MPKIEIYHDPAGSGLRGTIAYALFGAGSLADAAPKNVGIYTDSPDKWRAATPVELRALRIAELAHLYVRRDVWACQTSVVAALAEHDEDLRDAILAHPDPEYMTTEECIEYIEGHGGEVPDPADYVDSDEHEENGAWLDEEAYEEALGDAVRDCSEPEEIYEWWLVDPSLADDLRDAGHVVLDDYGCSWWGRGCTGQAIILDPTFWELAAKRVAP